MVQAFARHDLAPIDPSTYRAHPLHVGERAWTEANCYVDTWIEVLHSLGLDPMACMPFVVGIDWEHDQWTLFKPPHEDLVALYGVGVEELNVWRPLIESTRQQLSSGRLVLSEVDAFFLPDVQGTDYRTRHAKTTIGMQAIDVEGRVLDYFHNTGYYRLSGADFEGLFPSDQDPAALPLFAEFVRLERVKRLPENELSRRSLELLRKHLLRRPVANPISRWKAALPAQIDWLKGKGLKTYHDYAFATVRQLGAAFDLGALYLRWLVARGETGIGEAADDFDAISATCKVLIMKMARAANAKKDVDFTSIMETLESKWVQGMARLVSKYG